MFLCNIKSHIGSQFMNALRKKVILMHAVIHSSTHINSLFLDPTYHTDMVIRNLLPNTKK